MRAIGSQCRLAGDTWSHSSGVSEVGTLVLWFLFNQLIKFLHTTIQTGFSPTMLTQTVFIENSADVLSHSRSLSLFRCLVGLKLWRHVVQCDGSQRVLMIKGGLVSCQSGAMVNTPQQLDTLFSLCSAVIGAFAANSTRLPRSPAGRIKGAPEGEIQHLLVTPRLPLPPQAPNPKLTCLPCPHGGEPIPRSAWGRSARSDSSDSAGDPGRPLTGWPRASCHSCPHSTAARRRKEK